MNNMKGFLNFILLIFLSFSCKAELKYPQLIPTDQSNIDPSFKIFKNKLAKAVELRDSSFILNHLSNNVMVGFDAESMGIDAFRREWQIGNYNSKLWIVLSDLLKYGCILEKINSTNQFICPYIHALFPDTIDPAMHIVLLHSNVPIYKGPSEKTDIILQLDYAILKVIAWKPEGWIKITFPFNNSQTGFVLESKCYTAYDYRIYFEKFDNSWKISNLLGGD